MMCNCICCNIFDLGSINLILGLQKCVTLLTLTLSGNICMDNELIQHLNNNICCLVHCRNLLNMCHVRYHILLRWCFEVEWAESEFDLIQIVLLGSWQLDRLECLPLFRWIWIFVLTLELKTRLSTNANNDLMHTCAQYFSL